MTALLALLACGPRAWADRIVAIDAESALVVTADGELGIVAPGARWRSWVDLRELRPQPESLAWNGRAALATATGAVVWNPESGAWDVRCCGGDRARLGAGVTEFYAWEEGHPGTVGLGVERPAWRVAEGIGSRPALGDHAVLATEDGVVSLVTVADGAPRSEVHGKLRCVAGNRALVSTEEGLVALSVEGRVRLGPWSAPGGCLERGERLILLEGPASGPPDSLVEFPGGRTLAVGPFDAGPAAGVGAPRYLAALRLGASENQWTALDLDDWRAVEGPTTRLRASQIGVGRSGESSFGWCGEDVISLDGERGTWTMGRVGGWAGDAGAIAAGVAWTRTYHRIDIRSLDALSFGAAVTHRKPGMEPFPQCLGISD